MGSEGQAVAVWRRYDGSRNRVQAAVRGAGTGWGAPEDLSAVGRYADEAVVTADHAGNLVAAWVEGDLVGIFDDIYDPEVHTATFDGGGPRIDALTAPSDTTVGQPITASLTATDLWSALGTIGWDLGDGATATGPSVTHTYSTPGSYTVRATVADALGNTTIGTRTISVVAQPVPPTGTPPAPSPTPQTTTPPIPRPSLRTPKRLAVRKGRTPVRLRCRGARCRGIISVVRGKRVLARRSFALGAGKTGSSTVRLNRRGRALLARTRALRATVLVRRKIDGRWRIVGRRMVVLRQVRATARARR